ncbi:helix-hairpin-helix domain-containing protein [Gordonibacter sp. Marseille-P4307]|uniref:helix-hairpin-helix domain-containing protein n=1 Tax=Gordonibacter sp. Marseille-P4307 TaxID=2161815 RepID=UPI000F5240E6|nr:helix-hairpin-helix domain-containing protein [Gordonibacter sp. Marseille-P4307]
MHIDTRFEALKDRASSHESTKSLIGLGLLAVAILVVALVKTFAFQPASFDIEAKADQAAPREIERDSASTVNSVNEEPRSITVQVSGCVQKPGVYALAEGSRVNDAVDLAGGLASDAADAGLGLARVLADGEEVHIPSKDDADRVAPSAEGSAPSARSNPGSQGGRVNVNTATVDELQSLNGIGPSLAKRIVAYRTEHGRFSAVDQLTEVPGIGQKTLAKLKDKLAV